MVTLIGDHWELTFGIKIRYLIRNDHSGQIIAPVRIVTQPRYAPPRPVRRPPGSALGFRTHRREIGMLLPNNQRQHRTLHIQKDVLPYPLCASYCAPCQPRLPAFSGWIRSPPPTTHRRGIPSSGVSTLGNSEPDIARENPHPLQFCGHRTPKPPPLASCPSARSLPQPRTNKFSSPSFSSSRSSES